MTTRKAAKTDPGPIVPKQYFKAAETDVAKPPNFALYAFLISGLTFMLLAVFYVSMNERLDRLSSQQYAIATSIALIEKGGISTYDAVSSSLPFCYTYETGQKRLAVDMRKVTVACAPVNGTG